MNKQDWIGPKYTVVMRDCVRMFLLALCSVSGMAKAFPAMTSQRRQEITDTLLDFLKNLASAFDEERGKAGTVKLRHVVAGVG